MRESDFVDQSQSPFRQRWVSDRVCMSANDRNQEELGRNPFFVRGGFQTGRR